MNARQRLVCESMLVTAVELSCDDVADALRAALGTCGNCAHANADDAPEGSVFCAPPPALGTACPFRHLRMPVGERCTGWTPQEGA